MFFVQVKWKKKLYGIWTIHGILMCSRHLNVSRDLREDSEGLNSNP